jgi:hypothetical protein
MKKIVALLFVCFLSFGTVTASYAQCAMCRATVESNSKTEDQSIGKGLNAGIIYLMTIPYIAIGIVGYLWYRNSKKNAKANRSLINSPRASASL